MDRTRCRRSIITPSNYVDDNETKQRENIAKTVARGRIRFNRNFLIFCFASAVSYKRQRRSEITRTDNEEVLFNFLRVRKKNEYFKFWPRGNHTLFYFLENYVG